ncbi:MAG: PASTA domain-containing protein [Ruminococcaceae bacterium]|nr:PASTA domain-containing protein [Oscillospiraceae bacterium]
MLKVQKYGSSVKQKKRILAVMGIVVLCFFLLIVRIAYLQIFRGEELTIAAREQQTVDSLITPERGKIFDRNYKVLASNMTVETLSISPADVRKNENQSVEEIAEKISEIFGVDKEVIIERINSNTNFQYIKKKILKSDADKFREYMNEYKLSGFRFTEDTKRYYPYGNFASQVIGFVGSDNQGLEGIESVYDDVLSGVPGRIVTADRVSGMEIPDNYERYVEAEDGNSVVLTIDETIQHFAEKHLENARIENSLEEGAAAIVMDVNTGEILAMVTKPDYDLNEPFAITAAVEEKYPGIKEELEKLDGDEYNLKVTEVTQFLRRNKAVVDSYEPGSTFKIAVAAMALEEKTSSLTDHFYCGGSIKVADRSINCANRNGHGNQTFQQAVQNSCNPAFIQIGAKVGAKNFLKYLKGFGFLQKTGIELPGEQSGIFHAESNFKEIDLATSSFGQSFNVTPLQMISMASAVANGGNLMKPHLVKQIVDKNMNVVKDIQPVKVRQIVSKETSDVMRTILESVVSEGGGKNAYLAGYRIAGKTGTSEKQPRGNGKYVASFIGFAPADNPQVACLVILDQPPVGNTYYGGLIAAPVVKNILDETLQYLNIEPEYTQEELQFVDISVPDVVGRTPDVAKQAIEKVGFSVTIYGNGNIVTEQIPKANNKISKNSNVVLYTEENQEKHTVTIPDVRGMTPSAANKVMTDAGLNIKIKGVSNMAGTALCAGQLPMAGSTVEVGTVVTLNFSYSEVRD